MNRDHYMTNPEFFNTMSMRNSMPKMQTQPGSGYTLSSSAQGIPNQLHQYVNAEYMMMLDKRRRNQFHIRNPHLVKDTEGRPNRVHSLRRTDGFQTEKVTHYPLNSSNIPRNTNFNKVSQPILSPSLPGLNGTTALKRKPLTSENIERSSGKQEMEVGDYRMGRQIGQGAYASVRFGLHKVSNKKVAIKSYTKTKLTSQVRRNNLKREINILKSINHCNIVQLYEFIDTETDIHLIMEYFKGLSLRNYLKKQEKGYLTEGESRKIFEQIVQPIAYCHLRNIAHRDIKLDNILINSHGVIKLIDFGFSTIGHPDQKQRIFCGTPSYMAPEIIARSDFYGPPADIWALGILLYTILTGGLPFKGNNDRELYRRIQQGHFTFPPFISKPARQLIRKMLMINPLKRPTAQQILEDPWFGNGKIFGNTSQSLISRGESYSNYKRHNTEAIDLDIVSNMVRCNQKKMGFQEKDLWNELHFEKSNAFMLYKRIKESRGQQDQHIQHLKRLS